MYASTLDPPSPVRLWVKPSEVPDKQPDNAEPELVRLLQAGDEAAFREFIDSYGPKLYRQAYGILRNRDESEDIVQEVFAKVYFSIRTFESRSSLYSWASRIAINECYGHLRKKRPIYESDSADGRVSEIIQNTADSQPGAELAVMQRALIHNLLARLSEEERSLLIWKELDGCSLAELSEMTGLNQNTIKVKLFRARHRLARIAARSGDRRLGVWMTT
jgi:RNA polymerase sigma-70 factor (ECF subfamily)